MCYTHPIQHHRKSPIKFVKANATNRTSFPSQYIAKQMPSESYPIRILQYPIRILYYHNECTLSTEDWRWLTLSRRPRRRRVSSTKSTVYLLSGSWSSRTAVLCLRCTDWKINIPWFTMVSMCWRTTPFVYGGRGIRTRYPILSYDILSYDILSYL